MSQYSWFFVNKNYLLFAILATVLVIPVGFVTADFVFEAQKVDLESDGVNSFDGIQGPQGVEIFKNGTDNFALVASFDDDAVTLVNLSNPKDIVVQDSLDGSDTNDGTSEGRLVLEGASSLAIFSNSTSDVSGNFAIVTSYLGDGIQIIHAADSKSDTAHALYPTVNASTPWGSPGLAYNGAGTGTGPVLKGLDGAMDVAVFINKTGATNNGGERYAIITGHVGDSIQLIDITDPEVGGALYYNASGNFMNATADGGDGTHAATDYKGQWGEALSGRLPLDGAFGVDVFYTTETGNMPYAIVTGQVSDGFQIFSLNDTEVGPVPLANRTSSSTGFHLLDSPVGVATWNTTNNASDRWAIIASNYTDSVTVVSLEDPTNTTVTDTLQQTSVLSLDGALRVEVAKIGDRHYAFVTSNGTASGTGSATHVESGGFQVIDLYDPTNIQPVLSVTDNEGTFNNLGAAHDVGVFVVDGHTYAAVLSYDDDSMTIIQVTKDKTSGGSGGTCGVNVDCSAPSVSSNGGGVSINNAALATEDRFNDVDTVQAKVGQMVTIKANIYDSFGGNAVYKSNLYFDMPGAPEWSDASSAIRYDLARDEIEIVNDNDNFTADVTSNVVGDIVEVTFKIMFTGPMETSHIAIQNIDDSRNYQLKYFRDAIEVTGTPTQTSLTDTDDEITQTSTASVPAWVKNTAGWWAEGAISEGEFVKGVEYLIQQQIIDTDAQTSSSDGTGVSVPDWVKNTAGWWADGAISEGEFVNAIEHLVKTGTIIII
jgi:hypothetical protein